MWKFKRVVLGLLIIGLAGLYGCDRSSPGQADGADPSVAGKMKVVATYSILGDLVRQVGGDHIELAVLVGSDGDAHTYEPTPRDSIALTDARLVFENGLAFEIWFDDFYQGSKTQAKRVAVTRDIEPRQAMHEDEDSHEPENEHEHAEHAEHSQEHQHHHHGDFDPHAWHDVRNVASMAKVIAEELIAADPEHADAYRANCDAYVARLNELDTWIAEQVATIPQANRKLVMTHNAMGYFADRYGFEVITVMGSVSSEGSDPSAADMAKVIDQIKDADVRAVFVENMLSPDLTRRIAEDAGVTVIGSLYSDALGPEGSDGDSYEKMMRQNVQTIVGALR